MQEQSSDYFNVIVSGIYFDYLNIGDIAEIELPNYFDSSTKKIKIKVAGKLAEPYTVPSFNTSGTDINTYDLYQKLENGLIFVESSRLTKVFKSVNNCPLTAETLLLPINLILQKQKEKNTLIILQNNFVLLTMIIL